MGNDFVQCVAPTSIKADDNDENSDSGITLSNEAKSEYEIKEKRSRESMDDFPDRFPPKKPANYKKKRKKSKKSSMKKYREKHLRASRRRKKRMLSVEEELDATMIEVEQQKYAIKMLKKQNGYLRKQNEQFIAGYGSYFASSYNSNKSNLSSPERLPVETCINSVPTSPEIKENTISPLSSLSNKQQTIILSYSNCANSNNEDNNENIATSPDLSVTTHTNVSSPDLTVTAHDNNNNRVCIHTHSTSIDNTLDLFDIHKSILCSDSVNECMSIRRIIIALKWYSQSNGDYNMLLKKIMDNKYDECLMDDYQHILHNHLCQNYAINMSKEYQLIKNEINKYIMPCDKNKCDGYKRYNKLSQKNLSKCGDKQFCIDFIDLIHCYLIHTHDL